MPRLDALARQHPDVTVLAVNLDDPVAARALFDHNHYTMTLVADDGQTSERYGVTTIPHTVVIDRTGKVVEVARGGGLDLEREVAALSR
jgi:peroxiredoxin